MSGKMLQTPAWADDTGASESREDLDVDMPPSSVSRAAHIPLGSDAALPLFS